MWIVLVWSQLGDDNCQMESEHERMDECDHFRDCEKIRWTYEGHGLVRECVRGLKCSIRA